MLKERKGFRRPVGARVRRAVEIVADFGEPMTYAEVGQYMPEVPELCNVHKYLRRAVDYGLMERHPGTPMKFGVVPGWRVLIDTRADTPPPKPKARKGPRPVNSVFELGTRALP